MAIPIISFQKVSKLNLPSDLCPVCMDSLNDCSSVFAHNLENSLENRIHHICERCLSDWLAIHLSCPLCKRSVQFVPPQLAAAGVSFEDYLSFPSDMKNQEAIDDLAKIFRAGIDPRELAKLDVDTRSKRVEAYRSMVETGFNLQNLFLYPDNETKEILERFIEAKHL